MLAGFFLTQPSEGLRSEVFDLLLHEPAEFVAYLRDGPNIHEAALSLASTSGFRLLAEGCGRAYGRAQEIALGCYLYGMPIAAPVPAREVITPRFGWVRYL